MSPTAAMLILSACRSLFGSGAATGSGFSATGSGSGSTVAADSSFIGTSSGGAAQPDRYKNKRRAAVCPARLVVQQVSIVGPLVTEANSQYINVCRLEAVAQPVEFVKIVSGANAHAVIGFVINSDALYT